MDAIQKTQSLLFKRSCRPTQGLTGGGRRLYAGAPWVTRWAWDWMERFGMAEGWKAELQLLLNTVLLLLLSLALAWGLRRLLRIRLLSYLGGRIKRPRNELPIAGVLRSASHLLPPLLLLKLGPILLVDFPKAVPVVEQLGSIYFLLSVIVLSTHVVKLVKTILQRFPGYAVKPLDSYAQLINISIYFMGVILLVSVLLDKSPTVFLGFLGGTTAILLLIFKDPILGFVASIQLSANDMVRVGDWIQADKHHADGICQSITLTTVKVLNWDKTMAHIPTYALISESFTNWRSMETGGMRRFVRYLPFSSASVFFCTRSDLLRYAEVDLLKPELRPWLEAVPETEGAQPEPAAFLNHPRLTNLRVFCLYAEAYLRAHPQIDKRGMLSVSQQAPNERGLPVKLLAFSTRIGYVDHEAVQTEVFDHLVVAARMFDLELYEAPAWHATEPLPLGRSDARHGHLSEGANGRLGPPPPED